MTASDTGRPITNAEPTQTEDQGPPERSRVSAGGTVATASSRTDRANSSTPTPDTDAPTLHARHGSTRAHSGPHLDSSARRPSPYQHQGRLRKQKLSDQADASDHVESRKIFVDKGGQPLLICISLTVKDIHALESKIREYGGAVTMDERVAYIHLADPGHRYQHPMFSTEWVDKCISHRGLLDHKTPEFQLGIARRIDKMPYTLEEDQALRLFVDEKRRGGAKVKGNRVYQEFAEMHNTHSWQSWRERAVKDLKLTEPPSVFGPAKAKREGRLRGLQERQSGEHEDEDLANNKSREAVADETSIANNTHNDGEDAGLGEGSSQTLFSRSRDVTDLISDAKEDTIHRKEIISLMELRGIASESQMTESMKDALAAVLSTQTDIEKGSVFKSGQPASREHVIGRAVTLSPAKGAHIDSTRGSVGTQSKRLSLPNMGTSSHLRAISPSEHHGSMSQGMAMTTDLQDHLLQPLSLTRTELSTNPQSGLADAERVAAVLPSPVIYEQGLKQSGEQELNQMEAVDTSATTDLTDEDDLFTERNILEKMHRSPHTDPTPLSSLDQKKTLLQDGSLHAPSEQDIIAAEIFAAFDDQFGDEPESPQDFELPAKLLIGRTSSPRQVKQRSRSRSSADSLGRSDRTTESHSDSKRTRAVFGSSESIAKAEYPYKLTSEEQTEVDVEVNMQELTPRVSRDHDRDEASRRKSAKIKESTLQVPRERGRIGSSRREVAKVKKSASHAPQERSKAGAAQEHRQVYRAGMDRLETNAPDQQTMQRDAVREYYTNISPKDDVHTKEERLSYAKLMYYLGSIYQSEISELVYTELIHPRKAIDILDACSGNLSAAYSLINEGMTMDIRDQFWTREDDLQAIRDGIEDGAVFDTKHSLSQVAERLVYLRRTRDAAEELELSLDEIPSAELQKKRAVNSAPSSTSSSLDTARRLRSPPKKARIEL
ncbi:hypothetical protein BGZ99_002619 [Dissophora globulifera]|uniref:TERF2-interacting telomeric protein 1 Myb domain-containing protein n=1 Tax=Dissophora globulifera TaxID=979702 RepID=A0A9P6UW86_9FUNG|nr:hypothetical protein BGZ99_002619 [Dissophora globulifera]